MKRILCIIVAMSFSLALMACGRTDTEPITVETETTAAVATTDWKVCEKPDIIVPVGPYEDRCWVGKKCEEYFLKPNPNLQVVWRYAMSFRKEGCLPYKCVGQYNLSASAYPTKEEDKKNYYFQPPNDFYVVMVDKSWKKGNAFIYHDTGIYGFCVDHVTCNEEGTRFYALTPSTVLFKDVEDHVTAVYIRERGENGAYYKEVPFEELPDEEKAAVVYPLPPDDDE